MSYNVTEKMSTAKGRVAEGEKPVKFPQRYIQEYKTNEKGDILEDAEGNPIPTGDWNPESAAEAFGHYMELFPTEKSAKDDILFLINRRFYFDDQPGADPVDRAARKLAKDLGIDVKDVQALLSGLKKK